MSVPPGACTWLLVMASCALAACGGPAARDPATTSTTATSIVVPALPDALLLDVDIAVFDPGLDQLAPEHAESTPGVRRAEGHYAALRLKETLERAQLWGAVRVVPQSGREIDVTVTGKLLESDGRDFALAVEVRDASGTRWFSREYAERVERDAYDAERRRLREPFQRVYDRIVGDMQDYLLRQDPARLAELRALAELRFGARFAPAAFAGHLAQDDDGYRLRRLPAVDDPQLARIRRIRVRDAMYVEQMQHWYRDFDTAITPSYDHWREASEREAAAARAALTDAIGRTVGGILAVAAGVLAQGSDNPLARTAGMFGLAGGAWMVGSGLARGADARQHGEALRALSASLGAEVEPQSIALGSRVVELQGTVAEQYVQWQGLLDEIYRTETGLPLTVNVHDGDGGAPGAGE